jgi:hypothetical protein
MGANGSEDRIGHAAMPDAGLHPDAWQHGPVWLLQSRSDELKPCDVCQLLFRPHVFIPMPASGFRNKKILAALACSEVSQASEEPAS